MKTEAAPISIKRYFDILLKPKKFFVELGDANLKETAFFLAVSSVICAAGTVIYNETASMSLSYVFITAFLNQIGMTIISAGLGYLITLALTWKKNSFLILFNIYAFCFGIFSLVSWYYPLLFIIEICKWLTITAALARHLNIMVWHAVIIIIFNVTAVFLLFKSIFYAMGLLS